MLTAARISPLHLAPLRKRRILEIHLSHIRTLMIVRHRPLIIALLVLVLGIPSASAQFNLPIPTPLPAAGLLEFDMRKLFIEHYTKLGGTEGGLELRALAKSSLNTTADSEKAFATRRDAFCRAEMLDTIICFAALKATALVASIDESGRVARVEQVAYLNHRLAFWRNPRADVGRYLRHSGEKEGLALVPQFMANIGKNEAYVVTPVVRGLVGSTLFSADQAVVLTRSGEADTTKRKVLESDQANALRAINNGGTLVAHITVPVVAEGGGTWNRVIGFSVGAGVTGAVSGEDSISKRLGTMTGVAEWANSFPIRDLSGTNSVLADLIVSARSGFTWSGGPMLANKATHHVEFGQLLVGLRQNGKISVSALVTVANHGFNDYVPRLGVNFAAMQ